MRYISNCENDTIKIAKEFAKELKKGDVVTLDGDLGAGKTFFTSSLCKELGVKDIVQSPTFTIVNEYRTSKIPVFHFDVYRIESSEEMYDIGWEDYISEGAIVVVEWATLIEDIFDDNIIKIYISKNLSLGEDYREINIEGITEQ